MKYAAIQNRGYDDGYGGTTQVPEFFEFEDYEDMIKWVNSKYRSPYDEYRLIQYEDLKRTVEVKVTVDEY